MTTFVQMVITGVALSAVYAIVALGFTVIFKSTHTMNFAQGALLVVGGLLVARLEPHVGFWPAAVLAALATGLLNETAFDKEEVVAVDPDEPVDERLMRAELRAVVERAVAELPPQERALVQGHYFEGRRFDEVSAELGLSKSWGSRLHSRAVARLTERLRDAT